MSGHRGVASRLESARRIPQSIVPVAGCEPDVMGIGPVFAVPKLTQQTSWFERAGHWALGAQRKTVAVQVL